MVDPRQREGMQFGNYQLLRLLGQGRFAQVYLGEHIHLGTQAAIKVLLAHLAEADAAVFRAEARTLARLEHPHIVRLLEFGLEGTTPFLVMSYAAQGSLRQRHPAGMRLSLDTILPYVKQVTAALQYLHDRRLIHRDLKPENLLLGSDDKVLLSDFGLALLLQSTYSQQTQAAAGSIAYMAPEQIQGHPSPASDQYALGVVVYEWLCGQRPFSGTFTEVATQQVLVPPAPLHQKVATIPATVEQVVLKALAKDPKQRFVQIQDFAQALEEASRADASGRTLPVLGWAEPAQAGRRVGSMDHLPRGTVTLLFSDMERSTSLLQQLGERYVQVLGECRRLLRAAFHLYHGYEVDTQGDAFFAAFAHATHAVSAAVAAQRALASQTWPEGVAVRVRMGLHTGEPHLTPEGYVGLDVHRAAGIMHAAHGGQILLSQATHDLVEHELPDGVSLRDLGAYRLKDLEQKSHLYQVVTLGLPADFPPLKTLDTHAHNLPVQLTPLIGRQREVAAVQQLLQRKDVRLLTLTGPGGTGKTRLGLQVAAELAEVFGDGVSFVNLAPISDAELVLPTIAQALGVKEAPGQPLLDLVSASLREKEFLLLLDNFEQVVGAAVEVAALLTRCPKLKVLVTSRAVLHVRGEQVFAVPPLAIPERKHIPDLLALSQYEAVALFISRARAVKPEFEVTNANAPAVAEICVRLEGLPLAIELAAARIALLPPPALLSRLGRRFQVLTGGTQDVPRRQQTLRNTIAWSYDLLDAEEQQLFRHLSVFVGGCTLQAVETLCTSLEDGRGAEWILDGVASLIDKSLLRQTEQESQEPRLMMLETTREYGLECLALGAEMEIVRRRHAHYYLALAEEAEQELGGPQQVRWLEQLEREHDNLRAAMRWSLEQGKAGDNLEMAWRLGNALRWFWQRRGHYNEGRIFLERALAGSQGSVTLGRAKALDAAAMLAHFQGDGVGRDALSSESLALFQELGDKQGIAFSLFWQAFGVMERGQYAQAREMLEQAMTLHREVGNTEYVAWSLYRLAQPTIYQGDYAHARALCEESLALHRKLGNTWGIAHVVLQLARVLFYSQSDPALVRSLLQEALTLNSELGDKRNVAYALLLLGELALSQGDIALARSLVEESMALCRQMGLAWTTFFVWSHDLLTKVEALQGDYATARSHYEEGLAFARKVDNKGYIAVYLEGLADVVAAQGEPAWAARLWGAAEAVRETIGAPIRPVYRGAYERSVTAARAQLGEKSFTAAWAEGRTMTLEHVLAAQGPVTMPPPVSAEPVTALAVAKSSIYPDGLTAREVEVLRLVAQGLTDAQVAEALVISRRTVNSYLTTIYSKIGVSSRSAATRYAMEHHFA